MPSGIAISPDGSKIYAGWQDSSATGIVSQIEPATKNVTNFNLGPNASPFYVRTSPDGTRVYASDSPGHKLWVIDLTTGSINSYSTTFGPYIFEVSRDGTKGYFLNDTVFPYGIKMIDLASSIGTEIANLQIPDAQYVKDMVITSDESTAYVLGYDYSYTYKIYKIDLVYSGIVELIAFLPDQLGYAFSPNRIILDELHGNLIASGMYVDAFQIAKIPLSDPGSYLFTSSILLGQVNDLLLSRDGSVLFATYNLDYFHVFDANDINIIRAESSFTIPGVQGGPMVSSPDGKTVYAVTGQYLPGSQLNLEIIR